MTVKSGKSRRISANEQNTILVRNGIEYSRPADALYSEYPEIKTTSVIDILIFSHTEAERMMSKCTAILNAKPKAPAGTAPLLLNKTRRNVYCASCCGASDL